MSPVELAGSFVELLDELGGVPRLLVVDDLHWADAPTIDVLRLIVERLGHRRVLVVAAFRQPELVPDSVLATNLATVHLAATDPVRIAMRPLAGDEVTELIELTTGTSPSTELAERVHRRAGATRCSSASWPAWPATVGWPRISTSRRRSATSCATAWPRCRSGRSPSSRWPPSSASASHLRTVMAASDRQPDDCLDALDAAIVTRILVPEGESFRFAHALVRDAVLAEVAPLRLARLHARAADAILTVHGDGADDAEPIARHRIASLPLGDPLVVAKSVVHAADIARWSGAYDAGDRLAEQALDILGGLPHDDRVDALEAEALEAIVSAAHRRPSPGAIPASTQLVLDFADRTGSDAARALAVFVQHHLSARRRRCPRSASSAEQARELTTSRSSYARVMGNYVLAAYLLAIGQLDEASACVTHPSSRPGATEPDERPCTSRSPACRTSAASSPRCAASRRSPRSHAYRRVRAWSGRRGDADPNWQHMLAFHCAFVEAAARRAAAGARPSRARAGRPRRPARRAGDDLRPVDRLGAGPRRRPRWGRRGRAAMAVIDDNPTQEALPVLRSMHGAACLAVGDERAVAVLSST